MLPTLQKDKLRHGISLWKNYETTNEDLDEKSKAKNLGITNSQGNMFASLYNVLPKIFSLFGNDPSIPIPNLKTSDKW